MFDPVMAFNALAGDKGNAFADARGMSGGGSPSQVNAILRMTGGMGTLKSPVQYRAEKAQAGAMVEEQKLLAQKRNMNQLLFDALSSSFGGGSASGSMGGVGDLLSQLNGYGDGQRASINQEFSDAFGTATARLESRGMASSSLVDSALAGLTREKNLALGALNDDLIAQRIGIQERGMDRQLNWASVLANLLA